MKKYKYWVEEVSGAGFLALRREEDFASAYTQGLQWDKERGWGFLDSVNEWTSPDMIMKYCLYSTRRKAQRVIDMFQKLENLGIRN